MAIIRWNPWHLTDLLDEDFALPTIPGINRLGQGLNIYETEDSLVAEVALPGIPETQVDVSIDEGIVRISASHQTKDEQKGERRYFMSSMAQSFNYSFKLPEGIADKEPKAELENGVLTLSFEKIKKAPPKKVKVIGKGSAAKVETK